MKKLMTLGLLASSLAFADEAPNTETMLAVPADETESVKASYGYVSLGLGPFPIPLPLMGVGGRYQNGHHGFDGSLQFFTSGKVFTIAKENFDYLYYFKPNLDSQFYAGGGIGVTEVISDGRLQAFLSPQVVLGKQYTNKAGDVRYFQAQIDPAFLDLNKVHKKKHFHGVGVFPAIVISYGICF
ncbi:MAG: hypothetical protein JSS10_04020 [Verrucomicrobia bacterium]|nr:hypothetical protein [Verrucomicrobiota bacterium]